VAHLSRKQEEESARVLVQTV